MEVPTLTRDEEIALLKLVRENADRGCEYYQFRYQNARTHEEKEETGIRYQRYIALRLLVSDLATS